MKKHTYKEWLDGKIYLKYCPVVFQRGESHVSGEGWDNIVNRDIEKIKEKQQQILEEQANKLFEKYSDEFLKRYKKSQMRAAFLKDEISQCRQLLFSPIVPETTVFSNHWGISFESSDVIDMQKYIDKTMKRGIEVGFDFIHSPNCKYLDKTKPQNEIYAYFLWEYFKWLQEFNKTVNIKKKEAISIAQNESPLDLSNSTSIQKIIYLKELGIIDYLRKEQPFTSSINKLASILSAITGEQASTLQPSLNAMISNDVDKKNDPYKSEKTVEIVKNKLIHLGYSLT